MLKLEAIQINNGIQCQLNKIVKEISLQFVHLITVQISDTKINWKAPYFLQKILQMY